MRKNRSSKRSTSSARCCRPTIRRQHFGEQHIDVWNSLANLATMKESQEELADAEKMRREALALARKLVDEKNRTVVLSISALARTLWLRGGASLIEAQVLQ